MSTSIIPKKTADVQSITIANAYIRVHYTSANRRTPDEVVATGVPSGVTLEQQDYYFYNNTYPYLGCKVSIPGHQIVGVKLTPLVIGDVSNPSSKTQVNCSILRTAAPSLIRGTTYALQSNNIPELINGSMYFVSSQHTSTNANVQNCWWFYQMKTITLIYA